MAQELKLKAKVYLSDEGYGHIVRQRAVMTEIQRMASGHQFTLQTHKHINFARQNTPNTNYIDRYNNITWHKNDDSSPATDQIKDHFDSYFERIERYMEVERTDFNYDYVLSDFVYEAFNLAREHRVPSFGVSHFTWDWFFNKIYPRVISDRLFDYFNKAANQATKLYFPPFTPPEILKHYHKKAIEVPFIVKEDVQHKTWPAADRFKVLLMDSGEGLMGRHIRQALDRTDTSEWCYGVQASLGLQGNSFFNIPNGDLLIDYVRDADLIVGRPGFNTLSECIAYRKPMLLISESMNPEMDFNIAELKKLRLGAFISLSDFRERFNVVLSSFLKYEYSMIDKAMQEHSFQTGGARVIAADILNTL